MVGCLASWHCSWRGCESEFHCHVRPSRYLVTDWVRCLCCVTPPNTPCKAEKSIPSASGTAQIHVFILGSGLYLITGWCVLLKAQTTFSISENSEKGQDSARVLPGTPYDWIASPLFSLPHLAASASPNCDHRIPHELPSNLNVPREYDLHLQIIFLSRLET